MRKAILIAGPTASGKSALALDEARRTGGIVVNADSMQVYGVLDVLTARPPASDLAEAEHRLYGFVPPDRRCSVGHWAASVQRLLDETEEEDRPLVFVGGTGLYFEALETGIATMPTIPGSALAEAEALVKPLDREGRIALLKARDPELAATLREPDPQRLIRGLSVKIATGTSLARWQQQRPTPLLEDFDLTRIVIDMDRQVLNARIAARFETMMDSGAVAEVEALLALDLAPNLPAMKAIGVREIADWRAGRMTRAEAVQRAIIATRQYAKRQRTWFRHRMQDWTWRKASGQQS